MVKLPAAEENSPVCNQVVMFYYKDEVYAYRGPVGIADLEHIATIAANLAYFVMDTDYTCLRQTAINRARQLFKMEFKLLCHKCGTAPYQDEITAPER